MHVCRDTKHAARSKESEEEVVGRHQRDESWWLAEPESMHQEVSKR